MVEVMCKFSSCKGCQEEECVEYHPIDCEHSTDVMMVKNVKSFEHEEGIGNNTKIGNLTICNYDISFLAITLNGLTKTFIE